MKTHIGTVLGCPVFVVSPEGYNTCAGKSGPHESYPIVEGQDAGWKYTGDLRDDNVLTGLLSWVDPKMYPVIACNARIPKAAFKSGEGDLLHRAKLIVAVALYYGWLEIDQYPTPVSGDGVHLVNPLTLWGIKNNVPV